MDMNKVYAVYHQINPKFDLDEEKVREKAKNFPNGFSLVAHVESESIGDVFRLTNHIDWSWLENEEVEPTVTQARSTSVGDVVIDPIGTEWICMPYGWERIGL